METNHHHHNQNSGSTNGMSANDRIQPEEENKNDPFDPQEILFALWNGKWIILGCIIVAGAIGYYYNSNLPNQYETNAIFLIESQRADRGMNLSQFTGARSLTWNEVGTEMEFIRNSSALSQSVGKRLLNEKFNPATGDTLPILLRAGFGRLPEDQVVTNLGFMLPSRVRLAQIEEMNLVTMTTRSTDQYEAAFVLNFYLEEYQKLDEQTTRANLSSAVTYLEELEGESSASLMEQDQKVRDFVQQDWTMVTDEDGTMAAQELRNMYRQSEETQFQLDLTLDYMDRLRNEEEDVLNMIADGLGEGVESYLATLDNFILNLELQAEEFYIEQPSLRDNPAQNAALMSILQRLDYLENSRQEKLDIQRQGLRNMRGLDQASLTTYLTDVRGEIRQGEARLVDLNSRLAFLRTNISELQADMLQVMNQGAELQSMRRNMRINEELYLSMLKRLQETQVAVRSEVSRVREIRPAFVPGSPIGPNRMRNYILSLILGGALGAGIVLFRKFLDDVVHDPEELRKAGFNVIGVIPDLKDYVKLHFKNTAFVPVQGRDVDVNPIPLLDPIAEGSEAYRRLRTNIEYSNADRKIQTIVVSSSQPGEGKSITAMNLALTYAQYGERTLVIDCDLRKPTIHKKFSMDKSPGLSDLLFNKANFEESVTESGIENFSVLTSGSTIPNPAEIMGSARMQNLLKELRNSYDIIIMDTPPLLVVSDAIPLAVDADATLLVSRADKTELGILMETRRDLRELGINVVGTILNVFDYRNNKPYSYYKYNYKYKYSEVYKDHKINYSE